MPHMQQTQDRHGGPGSVFTLICPDAGLIIISWLQNQNAYQLI